MCKQDERKTLMSRRNLLTWLVVVLSLFATRNAFSWGIGHQDASYLGALMSPEPFRSNPSLCLFALYPDQMPDWPIAHGLDGYDRRLYTLEAIECLRSGDVPKALFFASAASHYITDRTCLPHCGAWRCRKGDWLTEFMPKKYREIELPCQIKEIQATPTMRRKDWVFDLPEPELNREAWQKHPGNIHAYLDGAPSVRNYVTADEKVMAKLLEKWAPKGWTFNARYIYGEVYPNFIAFDMLDPEGIKTGNYRFRDPVGMKAVMIEELMNGAAVDAAFYGYIVTAAGTVVEPSLNELLPEMDKFLSFVNKDTLVVIPKEASWQVEHAAHVVGAELLRAMKRRATLRGEAQPSRTIASLILRVSSEELADALRRGNSVLLIPPGNDKWAEKAGAPHLPNGKRGIIGAHKDSEGNIRLFLRGASEQDTLYLVDYLLDLAWAPIRQGQWPVEKVVNALKEVWGGWKLILDMRKMSGKEAVDYAAKLPYRHTPSISGPETQKYKALLEGVHPRMDIGRSDWSYFLLDLPLPDRRKFSAMLEGGTDYTELINLVKTVDSRQAEMKGENQRLRVFAFDPKGAPISPVECKHGRAPNIYLTDLERNPLPVEPKDEGNCAAFQKPSQPVVVVMRLPVPGFGIVYCVADNEGKGYGAEVNEIIFNIEAAKSRLHAVQDYVKKAASEGFTISDSVKERLIRAGKMLQEALAKRDNLAEAIPLAMESLSESMWAGEEAVLERARQQIKRNGPRKDFLFGTIFFDPKHFGTAYAERFAKLFNFATLPFYWHGDNWFGPTMWDVAHLNDGSYQHPFPNTAEEGDGFSSGVHKQAGAEEWCGIELGSEQVIQKVVLIPRPDRGFPEDFELQVSQDGKTWRTVKEFQGYPEPKDSTPQVFPLEGVKARYVRLLATKLRTDETEGNYYLQLMEFEVYDVQGRNVALAKNGGKAMASSAATRSKLETLDRLVDWCLVHHITPKGHPIVYGTSSIDQWDKGGRVREKTFSEQLQLVREHTRKVVERYKGKVDIFDVINEAHDWSVNLERYSHQQLLELTRVVTEETKRANPQAITIVNSCLPWGAYAVLEYYRKHRPSGVWYPYNYLKDCIAAGIPFDAVGLQLYYDNGRNEAFDLFEHDRVLEKYAKLGKPIHITELGVSSADIPDEFSQCGRPSPCYWHETWSEKIQADWVEQFYTIAYSKPYIKAITWWDFAETAEKGKKGHWWPHGGLLRADFTPKEAYQRLLKLISGWRAEK